MLDIHQLNVFLVASETLEHTAPVRNAAQVGQAELLFDQPDVEHTRRVVSVERLMSSLGKHHHEKPTTPHVVYAGGCL